MLYKLFIFKLLHKNEWILNVKMNWLQAASAARNSYEPNYNAVIAVFFCIVLLIYSVKVHVQVAMC